ncbi:hypothetical protein GCM10020229_36020 [Kitasatospora albolonga]
MCGARYTPIDSPMLWNITAGPWLPYAPVLETTRYCRAVRVPSRLAPSFTVIRNGCRVVAP